MKKLFIGSLLFMTSLLTQAQEVPYPIDESFIPKVSYIQNEWKGSYEGLDPGSRLKIKVSRCLEFNSDMTYSDLVEGSSTKRSATVVFKYEKGTYTYDESTGVVTFANHKDSVLDFNTYTSGKELKYTVTEYAAMGAPVEYYDKVQFSFPNSDETRDWILFDDRLMSTMNPQKKAVYLLKPQKELVGIVEMIMDDKMGSSTMFNLNGQRLNNPRRGVIIQKGKKTVVK